MSKVAARLLMGILAVALLAAAGGQARAAISISPAYLDLTLDLGRPAGSFEISNLGDQEERYRVRLIHFTFLREGGLREIPPDATSLVPSLRFNPKEFVLAPKTRQVVRFAVLPIKGGQPGEYWAGMELESLRTSIGFSKDKAGREFKLEVIPTILVPIFGKIGAIQLAGKVSDLKFGQQDNAPAVVCLVTNTGNSRLLPNVQFKLLGPSGQLVEEGSMGRAYVLRGGDRLFGASLKTTLTPGLEYTIRVESTSPGLAVPMVAEERAVWTPPAPPKPAATVVNAPAPPWAPPVSWPWPIFDSTGGAPANPPASPPGATPPAPADRPRDPTSPAAGRAPAGSRASEMQDESKSKA